MAVDSGQNASRGDPVWISSGSATTTASSNADRETLCYTFPLSNDGALPVTVAGLAQAQAAPRLFDLVGLTRGALSPDSRWRSVTRPDPRSGNATPTER